MSSPSQEIFKGTDRFLIQRRLGAGGFGVVYQAYDREQNAVVALKILRQDDAEALYRFKQEFRALADVTHPNLVSLYELMSDGEEWFFTMELVHGVDFLEYVREGNIPEQGDTVADSSTVRVRDTKSGPRDWDETVRSASSLEGHVPAVSPPLLSPMFQLNMDRLRSALKQLAEGVSALHEAGKLHRDIKPSNVLVTKEGRVVILDFGLVTELTPHGLGQDIDVVVGTPAYMSPEQGAGFAVSEASDWYSVGVILYKTLTGNFPFTGEFLDLQMHKEKFEPPAPSRLVPGLPEDLDALCVDLLRRLPEERPTGREVLRRLGGAETHGQSLMPLSTMRAMPLVGRERHLAALKEAFLDTRQGRAVTIYVHGSSGMGKSTLIRRFLDELQQDKTGALVLEGRCYERESVPYKALDSVVDALSQYLKRLPPQEAAALMPPDLLALARLFPVLRQVEAVEVAQRRDFEVPDSQELRRRAFAALRELFARLISQRPLALFIDDLQWGDIDSAALLGELLRPPDPPAMLLIASFRSEEAETSPLLKMLLSSQTNVGSAVEAREVVVGELSPSEARSLTLALMGEENFVSGARAEAIARESRGNPFFIDELVRYSQAGIQREQQDSREEIGPDEIINLDEVIWARVSRLSEGARRLLEILAVVGQPVELGVARRATRLDVAAEGGRTESEVGSGKSESGKTTLPSLPTPDLRPPTSIDPHQAALAALRAGHLVRTRGTRDRDKIEIFHDCIQETVITHLSPETLRSHHHRLALELEASGRADPETLAVHFQGAGDREKAAKYTAAAADQAFEALAFDRAARLYRLTLELWSAEDSKARALRVKLGDALANAGRGAEAAQVYLAAAEGAGAAEVLELQQRAAEQFLRSGHIDEGLAALRALLAMVGMKMAETPWRALLSLLLRRAQIRLRGLKFRECGVTPVSVDELLRIDTCWSVATGLGQVDPIHGADFQTRHLLLALRAGEPYRIARALTMEASYSSASGGRTQRRTEKLLQSTMSLAEGLNHPHALGLATLAVGFAAFQEARWKKGHEWCERAEAILSERCTGVTWELDTAQYYSLCSLQHMGELEKVFRCLPALLKNAQERGDLYAETLLSARYSYVACLAADEPERARQEVRRAMERWSQQGFHHQHYLELVGEVQTSLYSDSGAGAAAWNRIKERWPALTRSLFLLVQVVRIEALHLRARCALAAAAVAADPKPLLVAAGRDAGKIEREKMAWGKALAEFIRAGVAANRGKQKDAIGLLASAEAGLEAVDMGLYAAAARRRRGELIGGDEGRALTEAADDWMAGQKIKNPVRMTAMLAPGKWQI